MATSGPGGLPPSPSSPSAPGRLDEVPRLALLDGCLCRPCRENGSGAAFSTADRSRAAFFIADRSLAAFCIAYLSRTALSAADRSSLPPSCHIDEAGGGGEEFPLVARYGTNPVVPRCDSWARIDEPDSFPNKKDATCFRIWEASDSADRSRFQRWSCPADQRPDPWDYMHEEGGLPVCSDEDLLAEKVSTEKVVSTQFLTEAIESDKALTDYLTEVGKEWTDAGEMFTKSATGEYIQPAPQLRGCMDGLPQELVIRVARELVKSSLQDAVAMKLACKAWNAAFDISGPFLVVTRQHPASPEVSIFKIASQDNDQFPLALVPVDLLYPPPVHTSCWGSSKGLLALKLLTDNTIALHCPTCGFKRFLPNLPLNYDPKGIFVQTENFVISLMTDLTVQNRSVDTTLMFLQQLEIDAVNEDEEAIWLWDVYPGAIEFSPVRTVNFMLNATFCAATAWSIFILDRTGRLPNQPFVTAELGETLALDKWTITWLYNGHHIFICGQSAYLCILTRSILDGTIGVICFLIEQNHHELSLVEVTSFGAYSVYLGSNQPVVIRSIDGVPGRSPNTVYIEDNDGFVRNRRVLAINIATQAVQTISFPEGFDFAPMDFTTSAWISLSNENCHEG